MRAAIPISIVVALLGALPGQARAQAGEYTDCPAIAGSDLVSVAATSCEEVTPLVTALLAQPPENEPSVLAGAGWSAVRAAPVEGADEHDLVAIHGPALLRVRRPGAPPDLDGWEAGRELLFARAALVGGQPLPKRGAALCTSSFLIRLRGGQLGGLSAAHCGGLRSDGTIQRHNAALRRPPQPGIGLGRVLRIVLRSKPLDALVLRVPSGANRPASAVVERGIDEPPWRIVATAQPRSGRAICMAGRTSGPDRCGRILGAEAHRAERYLSAQARRKVRCTSIVAAPGDSGGPIYTAPRPDGTVRAIGIATLIIPLAGNRMCFTPINPVLKALGARLVPPPG